jgi:hypothetical protein
MKENRALCCLLDIENFDADKLEMTLFTLYVIFLVGFCQQISTLVP